MSVSLRVMTEQEFQKYSAFSYENYVSGLSRESNKSADKIKLEIGQPPSQMGASNLWYVIRADGDDVGYLWLRLNAEKNEAFGMDIWLEEKYRDRGIGREAMLHAKDVLKEMGVEFLRIAFFDSNARSKHLYTLLGFRIDAAIESEYGVRKAHISL